MSELRMLHLSDFHFDGSPELRVALDAMIERAFERRPDLVVVTGDLTAAGRPEDLDEVATALRRFGSIPRLVLPGNRDLAPSAGPPGEARMLSPDSDLEYFLSMEPTPGLGWDDSNGVDASPVARFRARIGPLEPLLRHDRAWVVGINSTPRLDSLERAARRLEQVPDDVLRVVATHHGLLPVPGRKLGSGDLAGRAGDLLAFLIDHRVDLVLHGHVHRAHIWQVGDGRHGLLISSAGALINDGRRDASFTELLVEGRRLVAWRRSVASGHPLLLYDAHIGSDASRTARGPEERVLNPPQGTTGRAIVAKGDKKRRKAEKKAAQKQARLEAKLEAARLKEARRREKLAKAAADAERLSAELTEVTAAEAEAAPPTAPRASATKPAARTRTPARGRGTEASPAAAGSRTARRAPAAGAGGRSATDAKAAPVKAAPAKAAPAKAAGATVRRTRTKPATASAASTPAKPAVAKAAPGGTTAPASPSAAVGSTRRRDTSASPAAGSGVAPAEPAGGRTTRRPRSAGGGSSAAGTRSPRRSPRTAGPDASAGS